MTVKIVKNKSYMAKDFFKVNLGHLLILVVWAVSFSYGYGGLNTRVTGIESSQSKAQASAVTLADNLVADQKKLAAQFTDMSVGIASMKNDVEWIKKNMK